MCIYIYIGHRYHHIFIHIHVAAGHFTFPFVAPLSMASHGIVGSPPKRTESRSLRLRIAACSLAVELLGQPTNVWENMERSSNGESPSHNGFMVVSILSHGHDLNDLGMHPF